MMRRTSTPTFLAALLCLATAVAMSHEPEAGDCRSLSRDLAHELEIMRGTAVPATAVSEEGSVPPRLQLGTYYAVSLVPQAQLHFVARPGRAENSPALRAGVFQFEVPADGRYRVSISSRHWIDVIDTRTAVDSVDHFGPGCELVHKVVEFDLPAGRLLTLQLSGNDDAMVGLAITASVPAKETR